MILPADKPRRRKASAEEVLSPSALYSTEAEKAVLGCMLAQPGDVIDDASSALSRDDFFIPAHQEIFEAIVGMSRNDMPVDMMTVNQWLIDRKLAEAVGSPGILAELMVGFATHLNVGSYMQIVKDKSLLRSLQLVCSTIVQDIVDLPDSVPDVLDRAEQAILSICDLTNKGTILRAVELTSRFEEHIGAIARGEKQATIKTGYQCIDRVNGGLKPGGMHVFGARPGLGKTTAQLNLLENLCEANVGVGMISLEMDHLELMTSIYGFKADINTRRFKDRLSPDEEERVRLAGQKIQNWPLQVDDCTLLDIHGMRHKARKMWQHGMKVLMIDYLQLMQAPDDSRRSRNRAEEVAEMSRSIKLLAKELNIPIIIGAQLNRLAAGGGDPGMHMLRESGAVEQDADVIIILKLKSEEERGPKVTVQWAIEKWRGGEAGFDLDFIFDKTRQRFSELSYRGVSP